MNEKQPYRMLWSAIVVLLLINVGLLAWLWINSQRVPRPPSDFFLEKELNFDEKQKDDYRKLRKDYFDAVKIVRDSVKEAKENFIKLIPKNLDSQALWKESAKVENINIQVNVMTYKHLQQVQSLCTPEQLKKFNSIIDKLAEQLSRPPLPPPPKKDGNLPPPPDGENPPPPR